MTDLRNLPKPQRDLIKAVKAEYQRNTQELAPRFAAHPHPRMADPQVQAAVIAQNTLRTCLEATLQAVGPYTPELLADLALRLASYAISAAPIEDHDLLVSHVVRNLADAHMARVDQGVVIRADWEMVDGRQVPNVPPAGAV